MTDDDRLGELFRDAAGDAPAAGFDHGDVVAASRRITARRRSTVVGGAVALLAVFGVGAVVAASPDPADTATSAAPAPARDAAAAPEAAAAGDAAAGAGRSDLPDALRGVPPFTGAPLGPGAGGCADRQDPALRAYVEQVLPEAVGAPAAPTTMECLPGSQRYLALEVDDAGARGVLRVSYLPPGAAVSLVPGAVGAPCASGGTVVVGSVPAEAGGPVPFEGRLDTTAAFLAPRL